MGRDQKDTVDYFPHFVTYKKTIPILERRWGAVGFTFWFKLLELLGQSHGHFYDTRNPENWEHLLAYSFTEETRAIEILALLAKIEAIDKDLWNEHGIIWSDNFVKNLTELYRKRKGELPLKPSPEIQKVEDNRDGNTAETGNLPQKRTKEKESKVKKRKVKEELSSEVLRLSDLLADLILKHHPNFRELQPDRREKTVTRWAEDIDKAHRLDKRSLADLETIIRWAQADNFWRKNILSGQKLRDQFDKLAIARKADMQSAPDNKEKRAKLEHELKQANADLIILNDEAGYFTENPNHPKAAEHKKRLAGVRGQIDKITKKLEAMA